MKIAIVTAAAEGWRAEWEAAVDLVAACGASVQFVAVNDVGTVHPDPLHAWASLHPDQFTLPSHRWEERRRENGLGNSYVKWGQSVSRHVEKVVRSKEFKGGSSGLFAVDVGLNGLDCDGVIGCGIPMDDRPNELSARHEKGWGAWRRFWHAWVRLPEKYRARIRFMSGRTAEEFGVPDETWIQGL